jgi:hypothetical protein
LENRLVVHWRLLKAGIRPAWVLNTAPGSE